jgi:methyl-accepting chemotaxis protein
MAIEPSFQIRLGIYGIDAGIVEVRSAIWRLLAPRLEAIISAYLAKVFDIAPFYRSKMEEARKPYAETVRFYTERLLTNPFDEHWVKDAYDRAAAEIKVGLDMRNRGACSIALLNDLSARVSSHYRFSPRQGFRLLNAASRIFMLDTANAVACHNAMQVQKSRERSEALTAAVDNFGDAVHNVRRTVTEVVNSIGSTSDRLAELAQKASGQAGAAARAAQNTASQIGGIASATDELNASIEQIHTHATGTVETARAAVTHSAQTDEQIRFLSQAVEKIGSVVSMIAQIAGQTNLLALNATIEAARAGEAGRGFAVVASEVKSLAVQTAKATDDVGRQISVVQDAMQKSMWEIESASRSISAISHGSTSLAEMVLEQARATNEIAKSASGASLNATTVTDALKTVQETIDYTHQATKVVLGFAGDLSARAAEVDQAMDTLFKAAAKSSTVRRLPDLAQTAR